MFHIWYLGVLLSYHTDWFCSLLKAAWWHVVIHIWSFKAIIQHLLSVMNINQNMMSGIADKVAKNERDFFVSKFNRKYKITSLWYNPEWQFWSKNYVRGQTLRLLINSYGAGPITCFSCFHLHTENKKNINRYKKYLNCV